MASRLSDQADRFRDARSRLKLRGLSVQMLIAGLAALAILVTAVIAIPRTNSTIASNQAASPAENGGASDTGGGLGSVPKAGGGAASAPGSVGSGRTTGGATGGSSSSGGRIGNSPAAPVGVNARGVTKTEILVGASYDKSAGGLNAAYGFAGIGQIDQKAAYEHIRDYINNHGGIGGRKMRIVWYVGDQLDGKSAETRAQEACTTWTQQTHVFAAFSGGYEPLDACLSKAGVVEVATGGDLSDASTYKKFPYLVELDGPALDRMARLYVSQLMLTDFYKKGRADAIGQKGPFKLGLVTYDYPVFRRATELFRNELAKHGIKLTDVAYAKLPEQESELANEVADVRSAVLKFKTDGVTHVNFLSTGNGFEQLTFWQQADDQNYYPRYGITSRDPASALVPTFDQAQSTHKSGSASARTFVQTVGVGWFPLFDVPHADYSGSKETPALRQCKQILSYESFDDPSRNKEAIASIICDPMFYLKGVIEKGGSVVNQRTYLSGVANIGSISSAGTFDMATRADRHDGMNAIKAYAWFTNCSCFHYTSGLKRV
jgi:hypothetical protein